MVLLQMLERWVQDTLLGNETGNEIVWRYIEGRIDRLRALRRCDQA